MHNALRVIAKVEKFAAVPAGSGPRSDVSSDSLVSPGVASTRSRAACRVCLSSSESDASGLWASRSPAITPACMASRGVRAAASAIMGLPLASVLRSRLAMRAAVSASGLVWGVGSGGADCVAAGSGDVVAGAVGSGTGCAMVARLWVLGVAAVSWASAASLALTRGRPSSSSSPDLSSSSSCNAD
jgi:hypothetical protein